MAWELVYTSAARGLAEGSRGFCTVAATRGMPASLVARLEALSGYRPRYGTADPAGGVQPVQWSHVTLDHAGQRLSVLSRIVHAGTDYSGRINKLAHHVALEPGELAAAGPAGMMRAVSGWISSWSGEPRTLEPRSFGVGEETLETEGACEGWEAAAGDAGYAGLLAEGSLLDPSRPFYVRHDPAAHDALGLVDEAIGLLPASARWGVTFATYFTDALPESDVAWRFVVTGTPAADAAAEHRGGGRWLDLLARPAGEIRESRYVRLARGDRLEAGAQAEQSVGGLMGVAVATGGLVDAEEGDTVGMRGVSGVNGEGLHNSVGIANSEDSLERRGAVEVGPAVQGADGVGKRVPATWFWAAALGWPVVLGAAGFAFWPMRSGQLLPERVEAFEPVAAAVADRALPSSASRIAEDAGAAAVALDGLGVDRVGTREADQVVASSDVAGFEAEPEPESEPKSEPGPGLESEVGLGYGSAGEMALGSVNLLETPDASAWVFAELPAAEASTSGSSGVLSASGRRLRPARALLWALPEGESGSFEVAVRSTLGGARDGSGLAWVKQGDGLVLEGSYADALGQTRRHALGRAWVETGTGGSAGGLMWAWLATPSGAPHGWADDALTAAARWSVFEVRDSGGRLLAEAQGRWPATAVVRIGGRSAAVFETEAEAEAVGGGLGALGPEAFALEVVGLPSGWRVERVERGVGAGAGAVRLVWGLEEQGGVGLRVGLERGAGGGVRLRSAWDSAALALPSRLDGVSAALEADRAWLSALAAAEAEGSVDALGALRDERPGVGVAEVEAAVAASEEVLAALEAAALAVEGFESVGVVVSEEATGVVVLEAEVLP